MSSALDSLKASLQQAKSDWEEAKKDAKAYQKKAKEIDKVYQELKEKKDSMKTLKRELKDFKNDKYDSWKGVLWKEEYKGAVQKVVTSYGTVIDDIDTNLDNLNLEKTRYENLANEKWGLVGRLASTVNSLITQIENWTN